MAPWLNAIVDLKPYDSVVWFFTYAQILFVIIDRMNKSTLVVLIAIVALVVAVVAGLYLWKQTPPQSTVASNADDSAIRSRMQEFGAKFKSVSLLAPDAAKQIANTYGPYASAELIAQWQKDPSLAPGKQTSSPWPERLDVVSVSPEGPDGYLVEANVIEMVNGPSGLEPIGVYAVGMRVEKPADSWVITEFEKGTYSQLPQRQTLTGKWECLPHKDTSGPQTMECAFGIAEDATGAHYAIDTSLMSTHPVDYATGAHLRVSGVVTPAEQLNSIQKYDIKGIIRVTTIEKL